jgi:hypothetical protein
MASEYVAWVDAFGPSDSLRKPTTCLATPVIQSSEACHAYVDCSVAVGYPRIGCSVVSFWDVLLHRHHPNDVNNDADR